MNLLKRIFNPPHIHYHGEPIVSQYWTFQTRRIIYECRCGHRKAKKVYRNYYENKDFPIPTNSLMSNKEFKDMLNGGLMPEL